jgi:hypothetical protein
MRHHLEQDGPDRGDVLDVLEFEDTEPRSLLFRLGGSSDYSVMERYEYGSLDKELIRKMAIREADRDSVALVIGDCATLAEIATRLDSDTQQCREAMDKVEMMARGIQGIALNEGQDFDDAVRGLRSIIGPEIDWELDEGIPAITQALSGEDRVEMFNSARYLEHHAPTHLSSKGRR